jgi:quercetin dioxygenase-like cupin family protein
VLLGERPVSTRLAIYRPDEPAHAVNGLMTAAFSGFAGSRSLEAVKIQIEADRTPPPWARHSGEEWVYVVSGVLSLEYDAETHLLPPGHVGHFDAERPHRLGAVEGTAEVLLVAADTPKDVRRAHPHSQ